MKDISTKDCSPKLPLSKVLTKWIRIQKQLARAWGPSDVPWWYNERADLSTLAGAIWRAKGTAFEEFVDGKKRRTESHLEPYTGRVDLHFSLAGQDFLVEAKECWSGASTHFFNPATKIASKLNKAIADSKKNKGRGHRRLAMVFAKPRIRTRHRRDVTELIKAWLKNLETIDCDAKACIFPQETRFVRWRKQYYPGIALFIKEI